MYSYFDAVEPSRTSRSGLALGSAIRPGRPSAKYSILSHCRGRGSGTPLAAPRRCDSFASASTHVGGRGSVEKSSSGDRRAHRSLATPLRFPVAKALPAKLTSKPYRTTIWQHHFWAEVCAELLRAQSLHYEPNLTSRAVPYRIRPPVQTQDQRPPPLQHT